MNYPSTPRKGVYESVLSLRLCTIFIQVVLTLAAIVEQSCQKTNACKLEMLVKLRHIFQLPTIREVLNKQLDDAERAYLDAIAHREYWESMQLMFAVRCKRLQNQIDLIEVKAKS
jgi:hypothetical protein